MSYATQQTVALTTAAGGGVTAYTTPVNGRILGLVYTKTDFDNGVVFLITTETTLQTLWSETGVNASTSRVPRQATHTSLGAAALYAAGGSAVLADVWAVNERVKIVIASGGNAKTGSIAVVVG